MAKITGQKQASGFKPGQSGNPAGRPKGARNRDGAGKQKQPSPYIRIRFAFPFNTVEPKPVVLPTSNVVASALWRPAIDVPFAWARPWSVNPPFNKPFAHATPCYIQDCATPSACLASRPITPTCSASA